MEFRQPVKPPSNLPQTLVDFIALVKDPDWLKSMVAAAQEITTANALTQEEADALLAAQGTIAGAAALAAQLDGRQAQLDADSKALAKRADDVLAREQALDKRNTALAEQETQAGETDSHLEQREGKVLGRERLVVGRENECTRRENEVLARERAVGASEAAVKQFTEKLTAGGAAT